MRTQDFDYHLPPELIAQTPAEPRDAARLLVLRRDTGELEHRIFRDLPEYLRPGDALVVNDSRVIPARLHGRRTDTGGAVEALLLRRAGPDLWEAMVRPGRRLRPGARVRFQRDGEAAEATVEGVTQEGHRLLRFPPGTDPTALGRVPLPPYIHAPVPDPERYQTVYAREEGSVAAPTAGLHFTPALLEAVRARGVQVVPVTLHVGPGTFRPVQAEDPRRHRMHGEAFTVPAASAEALTAVRAAGGRVVCVGTTTVRVLETLGLQAGEGPLQPAAGWTELMILPGHRFRWVDALITNFHLPRSTLLMLVSALAGREPVLRAYEEAVRRRYRFFSFGDAMLIL
ncbi:MAG TPA: tRNA preQ1(34) S-adenosylmethionine ribosyltransferase-isomerase QueA [Dehalococcoidia bacterium]